MSDELYRTLAANPSWFDAGYGYEENITAHNALGYGGGFNISSYDTASSTTPDGVQQGFGQAAVQVAGAGPPMIDMIPPFRQNSFTHMATAEDQSHMLQHYYDGTISFDLNEKSTSSAVASASATSSTLQASLVPDNVWYADAGASAIEQFHVRPSNNSLISPSAIQSVPQVPSGLVATHSFPTDNGQLDSEGDLYIIPYAPAAAAPKRQKRKRSLDDELAVTQRNVRRDTTTGRVLGEFSTMGNRQRKKAPLDEERRKETALARKLGTCNRCKQLKIRCNRFQIDSPYEPCDRCRDAKPYRLRKPCFGDQITVASFFRLHPAFKSPLETTNRKQIFELSDISEALVPSRTLRLTQGIGLDLIVHVAEFIPIDGDKTSYQWKDDSGIQREMKMPPYCLTRLDIAQTNMYLYAINSKDLFLNEMLPKANDITWDTIRIAMRFATSNKNSIVRLALEFWSYCRIIEQTWRICGPDTLGLETINDPTNRWNGMIPVTPIMDTQLDQIVIRGILLPLSGTLLRQLQNMIENHNWPETWFEIYLTSFILMTTAESVAIHGKTFARRYGLTTRYTSHEEMEKIFHGAKIVLSYFHYACNGSAPLMIDWTKEESARIAKLDAEEVKYMVRTQTKIRKREIEIRSLHLKRKYDTYLYWAHQLWFPNWKGTVTHIEDEIP